MAHAGIGRGSDRPPWTPDCEEDPQVVVQRALGADGTWAEKSAEESFLSVEYFLKEASRGDNQQKSRGMSKGGTKAQKR